MIDFLESVNSFFITPLDSPLTLVGIFARGFFTIALIFFIKDAISLRLFTPAIASLASLAVVMNFLLGSIFGYSVTVSWVTIISNVSFTVIWWWMDVKILRNNGKLNDPKNI